MKINLKKKSSYIEINNEALRRSVLVFRAINHDLRIRIIVFLDKNFSSVVKKIYESLELEQSVASQHLAILRSAGLVKREHEGKFRRYFVNYEKIAKITKTSKILAFGCKEEV